METIKKYIETIKTWSFSNPRKFIFIIGVISGFINGFIIRGLF